jgi:hypothetical protein
MVVSVLKHLRIFRNLMLFHRKHSNVKMSKKIASYRDADV